MLDRWYDEIMEMKVNSLSEAFRMIQLKNGQSTREIAKLTDMNSSTVWRTIAHPTRASSVSFFRLVRWSKLSWVDVQSLFEKDIKNDDGYR
jgi:hypothetical protein